MHNYLFKLGTPVRTFICTNGDTIDDYFVCDGIIDCDDGYDEVELTCKVRTQHILEKNDNKK